MTRTLNQPTPVSTKKEPTMKKYLIAIFGFAAMTANAQVIEQWNIDQSVLDVAGQAGFSSTFSSNAAAVSFTIPTTARCFKMEPSANYWTCADSSPTRLCGTSYTSATTTFNPWEFNVIARRIKAISGTVPTTLWVQADASSTTVKGHWNKCN